MINIAEFYMKKALIEAQKAESEDEVPVGAIIVHNEKIIAKAHNMCIRLCDPTAHAEMQVITAACNYLDSRYLEKCTIYTTLEPCIMCAGALFWSKIDALVYGCNDKKQGGVVVANKIIHPKTKIKKGVLEHECSHILTEFFKKKRTLQ
jgi:tRNA(adenine34) deaminase